MSISRYRSSGDIRAGRLFTPEGLRYQRHVDIVAQQVPEPPRYLSWQVRYLRGLPGVSIHGWQFDGPGEAQLS